VSTVRGLLDEYDAAIVVQKGLGVNEDAGRVLVKADVLEWEVDKGGRYEAVEKEKGRIRNDLMIIFNFCPIVDRGMGSQGTMLYRS